MRTKTLLITGIAALTFAAAACSSSGKGSPAATSGNPPSVSTAAPVDTSTATTLTPTGAPVDTSTSAAVTTVAGGVDPNAPEVVDPGDIPDNQVFVAFASSDGRYSVKVPEGWSRTEQNGLVTFTDKYNSIILQSVAASSAPTVDTVKASGLTDVSSDPSFTLLDVKPITRKAGSGILATYEIGSPPNEVTGKKALLAVERYVFLHNGNEVILTLSGAKGADNVDPWKTVTDSLSWK